MDRQCSYQQMAATATRKPAPAQLSMKEACGRPVSASALDLLRFVALSTSVHADALQASVDSTQAALMQMHSEEAQLSRLDAQLQDLLTEQRRLHDLSSTIERSRAERRTGEALVRAQQRRLQDEQEKARGGSKRIQSTTRRDVSAKPSDKVYKLSIVDEETITDGAEAAAHHASRTDAEVARMRRLISEMSRMSVRAKLLELELHKQAAREVDGKALMHELVGGFRFPPEVEQLWGDCDVPQGRHQAALTAAQTGRSAVANEAYSGRRSSVASLRRPYPPRSSSCTLNEDRSLTVAAAPSPPSVVDRTNVDLLIARATQRLTGRYRDALQLLTSSATNRSCEPRKAYASLVYAGYLDSGQAGGNPDADAVSTLQGLGRTTLAERYRDKCAQAIMDARIADHCFASGSGGGSNGKGRADRGASVLSSHAFCALPETWPMAVALTEVPTSSLLPPARHVLTHRFSFADANELKMLERLRIRIQRALLADMLDGARALGDLIDARERIATRATGAVGSGVPARRGDKDRLVADTRLAVAQSAAPGKPHAWPTIVLVAGDAR